MQVFLSHAAVDAPLAKLIEEQLKLGRADVIVFRTTRVGQIPAGKEWLAFIQKHLRAADCYMVLLTPWSMTRPWITFETGAAWFSERALVPVVAGDLAKGDVVEPLRSLQLLSLEEVSEATQAFKEVGSQLENPAAFCSAVVSLCAVARIAALRDEDWEGVDLDGVFYAWDGALEDLKDGQPKPVPTDLHAALRNAGRELRSGIPTDLMNEHSKGFTIVYQVDYKRRRKHMLSASYGQVLLSRPAGYREA